MSTEDQLIKKAKEIVSDNKLLISEVIVKAKYGGMQVSATIAESGSITTNTTYNAVSS